MNNNKREPIKILILKFICLVKSIKMQNPFANLRNNPTFKNFRNKRNFQKTNRKIIRKTNEIYNVNLCNWNIGLKNGFLKGKKGGGRWRNK